MRAIYPRGDRNEGRPPQALVRDAAVALVRFPNDGLGDEGVTLQQFRDRSETPGAEALPPLTRPIVESASPYDGFYLEAETLVWCSGHGKFTADDLGQLLEVSPVTVRHRLAAGRIPKPRYPSHGGRKGETIPHYWTEAQAVEILAAQLRKVSQRGC